MDLGRRPAASRAGPLFSRPPGGTASIASIASGGTASIASICAAAAEDQAEGQGRDRASGPGPLPRLWADTEPPSRAQAQFRGDPKPPGAGPTAAPRLPRRVPAKPRPAQRARGADARPASTAEPLGRPPPHPHQPGRGRVAGRAPRRLPGARGSARLNRRRRRGGGGVTWKTSLTSSTQSDSPSAPPDSSTLHTTCLPPPPHAVASPMPSCPPAPPRVAPRPKAVPRLPDVPRLAEPARGVARHRPSTPSESARADTLRVGSRPAPPSARPALQLRRHCRVSHVSETRAASRGVRTCDEEAA